jgi:hypothetical protein
MSWASQLRAPGTPRKTDESLGNGSADISIPADGFVASEHHRSMVTVAHARHQQLSSVVKKYLRGSFLGSHFLSRYFPL